MSEFKLFGDGAVSAIPAKAATDTILNNIATELSR